MIRSSPRIEIEDSSLDPYRNIIEDRCDYIEVLHHRIAHYLQNYIDSTLEGIDIVEFARIYKQLGFSRGEKVYFILFPNKTGWKLWHLFPRMGAARSPTESSGRFQ